MSLEMIECIGCGGEVSIIDAIWLPEPLTSESAPYCCAGYHYQNGVKVDALRKQFVEHRSECQRLAQLLHIDPDQPSDPALHALHEFTCELIQEMRDKLYLKAGEGFTGWDDHAETTNLVVQLTTTAARAMSDPKQWIDVANFAGFLWWIHGAVKAEDDN